MHQSRVRLAFVAIMVALESPLWAHAPGQTSVQPAFLSASARGPASIVDAFHASLRRGDARSAAALLADDALIFEGGGVERTKQEYSSHHLAADAAFSQAVPSLVTRRAGQSNGLLAWIASEGRTTGTYKGKAMDRITAETMVLRRTGRSWRIVHIHWSSGAKK